MWERQAAQPEENDTMFRTCRRIGIGQNTIGRRFLIFMLLAGGVNVLLALPPGQRGMTPAFADDTVPPADAASATNTDHGPVRMARFTITRGSVLWRPANDGEWSDATINLPLRQDAQIWSHDDARAEVQFDDGSRLRLDSNSIITLQTLYSYSKGEFTEITLKNGRAFLRLADAYSVYQVNTPLASVKASGPARIGVNAADGLQVTVRQGDAAVEGANGHATMHAGDYLRLHDADSAYTLSEPPGRDSWDSWNENRDRDMDALADQPGYNYLPPNVAISADDLDAYGGWRVDGTYGHVWVPREDQDWRPYYHGNWTWVSPFGWTWVSTEPWGWAPYHYGTWVHASYGWGWCPGPVNQYWCPGVVSFYQCGGDIAWCPLAPWEVTYPATLGVDFYGGNWAGLFSIGACGEYYPGSAGFCIGFPFYSVFDEDFGRPFHHFGDDHFGHEGFGHGGFEDGGFRNGNSFLTAGSFVPANARWGGSYASASRFGRSGASYHTIGAGDAHHFFNSGMAVGRPSHGDPVAGPQTVRPTSVSLTPTHSFRSGVHVPQSIADRGVFRATAPTGVRNTGPSHGGGLSSGAGGRDNSAFNSGASADHRGGSSGLSEYLRERGTSGGSNGLSHGSPGSGTEHGVSPEGRSPGSLGEVTNQGHGSSGLQGYLRDRGNGTWGSSRGGSSESRGGSSESRGGFPGGGGSWGGSSSPSHGGGNWGGSSGGSHSSGRGNSSGGGGSWGGNSSQSHGGGNWGGNSGGSHSSGRSSFLGGGHSWSGSPGGSSNRSWSGGSRASRGGYSRGSFLGGGHSFSGSSGGSSNHSSSRSSVGSSSHSRSSSNGGDRRG